LKPWIDGIWRNPSSLSSCLDELKEILQDEWAKITMDEAQACIMDMPK